MSTSIVSPFLLRGLGAMNYRAHEWLRPCTRQQRAANRSRVELWCWLLGASLWLLLTVWQLHAGSRRQRVASRRLQFMPQAVQHSVHCGWQPCSAVPEHVACFLRLLVSEPVKLAVIRLFTCLVAGTKKFMLPTLHICVLARMRDLGPLCLESTSISMKPLVFPPALPLVQKPAC